MDISIELVKKEEKEVLKNLLEKYQYEHSQYDKRDVNNSGLFEYTYLDSYWTEKNWFPYFIKVDNILAGFVMVNDYKETKADTNYTVSEFFILYKYRRKGVGKFAVKYIFEKHNGKWQLSFHPNNETSKVFWLDTINEYTKGNYKLIENNKDWIYEDGTKGNTLIFDS